jgi:hypothetical protein
VESQDENGDLADLEGAQALFLHERLVEGALGKSDRERLLVDVSRHRAAFGGSPTAHVGAYEDAAALLFSSATELDVDVVSGNVQSGHLVALTQDFYIRRDSDERGSFRAGLATDREIEIYGHFSTSRLVGSTGRTETFGHHRFSMLAYVGDVSLVNADRRIELRPLFIGWRVMRADGLVLADSDRREVWPQQIDQFARIANKRATAGDRAAVAATPEREIKAAFAEIIGEPFVTPDWGGETSDLSTSRLTMAGTPLSAAFAFKGPGLKGTLQISGMGKNGDQALRLAHESVDLYVIQHHGPIAAAVRNLMSALARTNQRRFMVIDGETTAIILREYDKLT